MKERIAAGLILSALAAGANACTCQDTVGAWDVTYKLVTDWTDRVHIFACRLAEEMP